MNRKLIVAASAIILTAVGFIARANHRHFATATTVYFQTAHSGFSTVFSGGTTNLNTVSNSNPASINTGSGTHRLYASATINHPLYWK